MSGRGAVLIARVPKPPRAFEPILVTLLRRYVRRGAPASLVERLAGGKCCWRLLNLSWNIDGRVAVDGPLALAPASMPAPMPAPIPIDETLSLSSAERRIALIQLVDDYAAVRCALPAAGTLACQFGVSAQQIARDLDVLRAEGQIAQRVRTLDDGAGRRGDDGAGRRGDDNYGRRGDARR